MKRLVLATLISCAIAGTARADYDARVVGNWLTSAKGDRFGDGGAFSALTGDGSLILAVRCIRKRLSIAVLVTERDPKPLTEGAVFAFKFKVDRESVVETAGTAIDPRLIQLETQKSLVKAIRDGRETAVRMETPEGVTSTYIFKTTGAPKAFTDLSKECPLE